MLTQLKGVLFLHMPKWRERIEKIQNGILDNSNNNYIIFCFSYYWACAVLVVTAGIPTSWRRSKRNAKIYIILRALMDLFFLNKIFPILFSSIIQIQWFLFISFSIFHFFFQTSEILFYQSPLILKTTRTY